MMCLGNENWSTAKLSFNIQGMVDTLKACYPSISNTTDEDQFIKWNNNNHSCVILNVDGSCLGSPIRAGYGGILRNDAGFFLSGFSGYIQNSSDILYVELYAIYKGLLLAKEMGNADFVCYFDSLHCINILNDPPTRFHAYAVLIQDIKELLEQGNVMVNHTLREGNQCAVFLSSLVLLLLLSFFSMSLL
jgi:ribonuclease HI